MRRSWFIGMALCLALSPLARAANPRMQSSEAQVGDSAPAQTELEARAASGSYVAGALTYAAAVACRGLAERGVFCQPLDEERRQLVPGVGYYRLQVQVGPGEHDVISLHRVVAERRPGHAEPAPKAVFMIHGDIWGFEPAFLGLTLYAQPPKVSLPVFLAQNRVDAWGISYRWAHIPVGFPDQSFMAGWGMDVAIADARIGLRIARAVRRLAGQGNNRLHVLGWSRGVFTTMALANGEATEPLHRRDIAGLIPIDGTFKPGMTNEAFRQSFCGNYDFYKGLLESGIYGDNDAFFNFLARQAIDAPDEPSPIAEGLSNLQFALGFVSSPLGIPGMEWYHFVAGLFDDQGAPLGPAYAKTGPLLETLARGFGYDPIQYEADTSAIACDVIDVPWDDSLAEVRLPLLYLGAGGGFGNNGAHIAQLTGGHDVASLVVRKQPPELAAFDLGHMDIFQAPAARQLFWDPILAWIRAH
jgi:hypothetical protein